MLRPLSYCLRRSVASFVRSAPVIRTPFFSAAIVIPFRTVRRQLRTAESPHALIAAHLRSRRSDSSGVSFDMIEKTDACGPLVDALAGVMRRRARRYLTWYADWTSALPGPVRQ